MHKKNTSVMEDSRESLFELLIVPLACMDKIIMLDKYKDLNMICNFHTLMIRQDFYRSYCCC